MTRLGPGNLSSGGGQMEQLAQSLVPWAGRIVVDKTGLTGAYEFDLTWAPDPTLGAGGPPPGVTVGGGAPPPGVALPAPDPNAPSLFTAVQEQLGLKLDSTKAPVEVLVIDHVEQPEPD